MTGAVIHSLVRIAIFMVVIVVLSRIFETPAWAMPIRVIISGCLGIAFGSWAVRPIVKQMVMRSR